MWNSRAKSDLKRVNEHLRSEETETIYSSLAVKDIQPSGHYGERR